MSDDDCQKYCAICICMERVSKMVRLFMVFLGYVGITLSVLLPAIFIFSSDHVDLKVDYSIGYISATCNVLILLIYYSSIRYHSLKDVRHIRVVGTVISYIASIGSLAVSIYLTRTVFDPYYGIISIMGALSCIRAITFLNFGSLVGTKKRENSLLNDSTATLIDLPDRPDYFHRTLVVLEKVYVNSMKILFGICVSLIKMTAPAYHLLMERKQPVWAALSLIGVTSQFLIYLIAYALNPSSKGVDKNFVVTSIYLGGIVAILFTLAGAFTIIADSTFDAILGALSTTSSILLYHTTITSINVVPIWIRNEKNLKRIEANRT
ncbi:hypothetical protein HDV04_002011 [Boothiomyces sp. JEL0838]|nr:hypothetical protein HDV04_002011 [Boothiomyces sp. JEL0838]